MNLAELKESYKARKLALDSAKKEEEKYKALLKDAMLEAGESDYTDEDGYRFERIVQERKSMDEEKLLAELHERNLTSCIATKEVVDEDATLKAVEAGELPQEVLADPAGRKEILDILLAAKEQTTILFSTHILSDVERICTEVAFLNDGKIAMQGTIAELRNKQSSNGFIIEIEKKEVADMLAEAFNELQHAEENALIFQGNENRFFDMMQYISENRIPIQKIERLEPTLETLFLEVTK